MDETSTKFVPYTDKTLSNWLVELYDSVRNEQNRLIASHVFGHAITPYLIDLVPEELTAVTLEIETFLTNQGIEGKLVRRLIASRLQVMLREEDEEGGNPAVKQWINFLKSENDEWRQALEEFGSDLK